MYTGSLAPTSNREDWIMQGSLVDDDGTDVVLTGSTMNFYLCRQGCPNTAILSGSTTDGEITFPTTTTFQIAFTPDDMGALCAGTYDVFLRIIVSSITTQIFSSSVQILDGGPSA